MLGRLFDTSFHHGALGDRNGIVFMMRGSRGKNVLPKLLVIFISIFDLISIITIRLRN